MDQKSETIEAIQIHAHGTVDMSNAVESTSNDPTPQKVNHKHATYGAYLLLLHSYVLYQGFVAPHIIMTFEHDKLPLQITLVP